MHSQLGIDFCKEMTGEELRILRNLKPGRQNATPVPVLARLVGVPERRLQQIVRHLISDHGKLIGSVTSPPTGYYLITCEREVQEVCSRLRHRAISILHRVAKLRKTSVIDIFGQGEL